MTQQNPARRNRKQVIVAAAGTALIGSSLIVPAVAAPQTSAKQQSESLSIMLTNDDGWDAPGITAVYDALVEAGHEVTMVAPAVNQSGSGARTTFHGPMVVAQPEPGKYWVQGSPADATEFGLSTVFADEVPDLVISGTNSGQNIGAATITSGTVGAAATAINEGVPAIAVSTEGSRAAGYPFGDTANFVVDLLDSLDKHSKHGQLLPSGVGLNVNYPLVDDGGEPQGVELTSTGIGFIDLTYAEAQLPAVGEESTFTTSTTRIPETLKNADTTALDGDKVAVSLITGNYDIAPNSAGPVQAAINALD